MFREGGHDPGPDDDWEPFRTLLLIIWAMAFFAFGFSIADVVFGWL